MLLLKTNVTLISYNNMIQQMDIKQFSSVADSIRHKQILFAWSWISARMVMYQNNIDGMVAKCLQKNFSWRNQRGIYGSTEQFCFTKEIIFCVQHHTD